MVNNGELQEHVVPKAIEGGWLDAELRDTFPASDPLPHWAGPPRPTDDADRARRRVVRGEPVRQVEGHKDRGAPMPQALPRDMSPG